MDAAYATTVSGPTRKLEASPRGIFWPPAAHDDEDCWSGIRQVAPYFLQHLATRGAGITTQQPHEGATYPYPLLIALDDTDSAVVHDLVQVIHQHYDEYKDADPGAVGWAMDRQLFDWVVPYHDGAVRYFREIGVWSEAFEAHNQRLLARQQVLAETWRAVTAKASGDDFEADWLSARAAALEAAGFEPIWTDAGSS